MIIGLTGYAQSGKDTVAKILVEKYGFVRVAFADKIRELLYEMDPPVPTGVGSEKHVVGLQNYVDIYGWDVSKQNPTVRSMLQNLGVGARTVFGEWFWIEQAMRGVSYEDNVVVTDVRFTNEAEFIKKYDNAQLWRVTRPGVEAVNNHVSESQMDNYKEDVHLLNTGTLDELELLVQLRMDSLLNGN